MFIMHHRDSAQFINNINKEKNISNHGHSTNDEFIVTYLSFENY